MAWTWLFPILAAALAIPGGLLLVRGLFRDRPRGRLRCPRCWYDVTGVPTVSGALTCPECGRPASHERQLRRTRRHWRPALAGLFLIAAATLALGAADALRHGWPGAVPLPILTRVLSIWEDQGKSLYGNGMGSTAGLTRWERLLVARHCGTLLDKPPQPNFFGGVGIGDYQIFQTLAALKADGRPAIPALARRLEFSPGTQPRLAAANALGEIGGGAAVRSLRRVLQNTADSGVRIAVLNNLAKLESPRRAHRLLVVQLGDADESVRAAAAGHLGARKLESAAAAPSMARAAEATRGHTELRAITVALSKVGPRGVTELGRLLHHERAAVRASASDALNRSSVDATPALADVTAALDDTDALVRAASAETLERVGPTAITAVPRLLTIAASDTDAVARYAALRAAARLAPARPDTLAALATSLTDDPDIGVRYLAASELLTLGPAAALAEAALRHAAEHDEDGLVRQTATGALEAIGPRPP